MTDATVQEIVEFAERHNMTIVPINGEPNAFGQIPIRWTLVTPWIHDELAVGRDGQPASGNTEETTDWTAAMFELDRRRRGA